MVDLYVTKSVSRLTMVLATHT